MLDTKRFFTAVENHQQVLDKTHIYDMRKLPEGWGNKLMWLFGF
jgi:hypothetical protein